MSIITKRAFMDRCHISAPTCYKWIKKNRNGLSAYVRNDGIDDSIFDLPEWSRFKSADDIQNEQNVLRLNEQEQEVERLRSEVERLQSEHESDIERLRSEYEQTIKDLHDSHEQEVERLRTRYEQEKKDLQSEHEQELSGLRTENEKLQTQLDSQQEVLSLLNDQLKIKDTQINQLHVLIGQKSLPKPRRTFLEWLGVKRPSDNNV